MPSLSIALESSITVRGQSEKQVNAIFGTAP